MKSWPNRTLLLLILLLALVLRIGWALAAPRIDPLLRENLVHGEAAGYYLLAVNLAEGWGFSFDGLTPTAYRTPGYPALLTLFVGLGWEGLLAIRVFQALLGTLLVWVVYALGVQFLSQRTALLAALGTALYPLLIYITGWIYPETLFLLLFWAGLLCLARVVDRPGWVWPLLAGGLIGLAVWVQPQAWVTLPLMLLVGLVAKWEKGSLKRILVAVLVLGLVLLPWLGRNTLVFGGWVGLTSSCGSEFYAGNNPQSQGGSAWVAPQEGMTELESDRVLQARAWDWIRGNPGEALVNLGRKLVKFLSPIEFGTRASDFGALGWVINAIYAVFLLLAGWGAYQVRRHPITLILVTVFLAYLLTALVFYGGSRVALPAAPALILLASAGLADLLPRLNPSWTWMAS
jgi:4-amino-4-deoxy-L-arabinose transferase-like glycosyltransferase